MNILNNFKRFLKSFVYAFKGILSCIRTERNMRVHMCVAFYVLIFMRFFDLSKAETATVFIVIGAVITMEILNTAIEAIVDLCSPEYNKLAMLAKDLASAAVLCIAVVSVAVAFVMFWDIKVFKTIFVYLSKHPFDIIGLTVSVILWFLFIFAFEKKSKNKENADI